MDTGQSVGAHRLFFKRVRRERAAKGNSHSGCGLRFGRLNCCMKPFAIHRLVVAGAMLACVFGPGQTTVMAREGAVRGRVTVVNPATHAMTIAVEPGDRPMVFYGLERARIERPTGKVVSVT